MPSSYKLFCELYVHSISLFFFAAPIPSENDILAGATQISRFQVRNVKTQQHSGIKSLTVHKKTGFVKWEDLKQILKCTSACIRCCPRRRHSIHLGSRQTQQRCDFCPSFHPQSSSSDDCEDAWRYGTAAALWSAHAPCRYGPAAML